MSKWLVRLEGSSSDFELVSKELNTDYARLEQNNDIHYLSSINFDSLIDPNDVLTKATELLAIIKSIFKHKCDYFLDVDISGINRMESDGRITQFILPIGILSEQRFGMTRVISNTMSSQDSSEIESMLGKILQNPKATKANRLYELYDHNWDNLYKIFEVIQSDVGGSIVTDNWATQRELDRFTQTANSEQAIGDVARHGHNRISPPSDPMSLDEAKSLIDKILKHYNNNL